MQDLFNKQETSCETYIPWLFNFDLFIHETHQIFSYYCLLLDMYICTGYEQTGFKNPPNQGWFVRLCMNLAQNDDVYILVSLFIILSFLYERHIIERDEEL